jgi:hypothetical protein
MNIQKGHVRSRTLRPLAVTLTLVFWLGVVPTAGPAEGTATDLAGFERVGAVTLLLGENQLPSAVMDPAGDYAYFGTATSPGRVTKINLATFQRVGGLTLASGENGLYSAVVDPSGQFAYFGTVAAPGRVVKVRLTDMSRVAVRTMESGENYLYSAVIDPAGMSAYFGTYTSPGRVVKVDLTTFERDGSLSLPSEVALWSAAMDPAGRFAYFGVDNQPGRVAKIDLASFSRAAGLMLPIGVGEDRLLSAVVDPAGEFGYFGTDTTPGRVVKVRLSDMTRVGVLTMEAGENGLRSAVMDPAGRFAFFGTNTIPGRVVKIRMADFTRVGAITLSTGENYLRSAVVDPAGEYAYFGTATSPGRVIKVALGTPAPTDTTTTMVSDPSASVYGQPITVTATITPAQAGDPPVGTVVFRNGTDPLGSPVPVVPTGFGSSVGTASLAIPPGALPGHEHPHLSPYNLSAEYVPAAGAAFLGSTGSVNHQVGRADFTVTLTPVGPLHLTYPAIQTFAVTIGAAAPSVLVPENPAAVLNRSPDMLAVPADGTVPVELSDGAGSASMTLPVTVPDAAWYVSARVAEIGANGTNFNESTSSWVTVTVDKAALTVTGPSPQLVYGDPAPTLEPSYDGLASGDIAAEILAPAPTCSSTYRPGSPPGNYPTTCSGGSADNYLLTYLPGTLTVAPAPLIVTVDDHTVQYSDPLPTTTVGYRGFVLDQGSGVLSGTQMCATMAEVVDGQVLSPAGTYDIVCSGLASSDYELRYVDGSLIVTQEDAVVRLAQNNPHAVAVSGKKPTAPELSFTARIAEAADGSYGDVVLATPMTLTLHPIEGGGVTTAACTPTRTQPATTTDPGVQQVTCTLTAGTPIGVYLVSLEVGGSHYRGADASVLTVYDPTAGGSSGAGLLTNPNTGNFEEIAYSAEYLKNGKQIQGRFLFIARDTEGSVLHVLKGNVMSTMAITASTAMITGKATLDGVGNYTYILTGIDNATPTQPNPPTNPDRYGQRITDPAGAVLDMLTFDPVPVTSGNIHVGK